MADSEKRKTEDAKEESVVEKKTRFIDVLVSKERKSIEAWTRIVENLSEVGIRECDACFAGIMRWTKRSMRYVELQVLLDHETSVNQPIARYQLRSNNDAHTFYEMHWKDALLCLKNWIEAMNVDSDRERITTILKSEHDAWDSFLESLSESFPNEKIPAYSEYSFIDGHLVLEWHGKNGRVVTLDRVPCPAYDDENGEPGVYKDGRAISFRVSKSPERPLSDKTESVFVDTIDDVVAKIAEFLQ